MNKKEGGKEVIKYDTLPACVYHTQNCLFKRKYANDKPIVYQECACYP